MPTVSQIKKTGKLYLNNNDKYYNYKTVSVAGPRQLWH